ncbi:MAG: plasmid replication protein RepC [Paracoccaceae bacterium]
MAFTHATAPLCARPSDVLSADNAKPDRFTLMETIRRAAPALRLGPSVVATLDALLSCLPPKRNHDLVFASNATIVMRRNGITDRTLRRHLAELVAAGLLVRIDSPNGKRYSKCDPAMQTVLRFGLDLSPLFSAYQHLCNVAQQQRAAAGRNSYLRTKLRIALQHIQPTPDDDPVLVDARKALRRKVSNEALENLLAAVENITTSIGTTCCETPAMHSEMSASNGQNVRHQQSSEKEFIERKTAQDSPPNPEMQRNLTLTGLTEACKHAAEYLPEPLQSPMDVITHATRLAPMMGVDRACYEAAVARHGPFGAALTIWGVLEMQGRIRQLGAYFRSITSGTRSSTFCPWQLIDRLAKRSDRLGQNCPRTMVGTGYAS